MRDVEVVFVREVVDADRVVLDVREAGRRGLLAGDRDLRVVEVDAGDRALVADERRQHHGDVAATAARVEATITGAHADSGEQLEGQRLHDS